MIYTLNRMVYCSDAGRSVKLKLTDRLIYGREVMQNYFSYTGKIPLENCTRKLNWKQGDALILIVALS